VHEFSQQRHVTELILLHNFASLVLRPPSLERKGLAPDEDRLKQLGDKMASDTGYTSQYGWQLYDTSGTTEDWNYAAAGAYGYTIELGPAAEDGATSTSTTSPPSSTSGRVRPGPRRRGRACGRRFS
jgi:Zinc carboxypeptidase